MKNQVLFYSKDMLNCCLQQFLFGALRVNSVVIQPMES